MRLAGKVAIISGAASGMGAATARMFAREGAKVMIMMAARLPAVRAAATAPSPTAKSLPLATAGTASNFAWSGKKTTTLYRVTGPADPVLVHGNRLGGAKGPRPVPLQCDAPPCGPPP